MAMCCAYVKYGCGIHGYRLYSNHSLNVVPFLSKFSSIVNSKAHDQHDKLVVKVAQGRKSFHCIKYPPDDKYWCGFREVSSVRLLFQHPVLHEQRKVYGLSPAEVLSPSCHDLAIIIMLSVMLFK